VLRQFDSYEEKQRKLSEVKNKLESLVYMIREIVEQKEFMKFSVEEERNELLTKANEHHEYLESDAAFEGIFEDFNKKLIQLRNL
jgi:hypoxia up-regulated 1